MSLTGKLSATLEGVALNTATGGTAPLRWQSAINHFLSITGGTAANQVDRTFSQTRTLAASANEDLDLSGTALLNVFNVALAFARVRAIILFAAPGNTNNVVMGGASSNAFVGPFGAATHTLAVAPGNFVQLTNGTTTGWPVTAGTGDLLRIANGGSGTPVTYTLTILGASA